MPKGTEGQSGDEGNTPPVTITPGNNAGDAGGTGGTNGAGGDGGQEFATWDEVVTSLTETQRTMYTEHTQGLRSALDDERKQRKTLSKQLRDATAELEEGSQARDALEALQANLDEAEARADFAEDAVKEGITNPRLAWLAAQQIDAFDRRGNVDWTELKAQFPELFRKPTVPAANAGAGTSTPPKTGASMNQLIRQASGRPG